MKFRWFNLLLLVSLLLIWPAHVSAQNNAINWKITPGFDGSYKSGAWFPLTITVSNDGPDVRGTLDMRFRSGQATTYSQPIDLPRGAKKQIVLPVASDTTQDGSVKADVTLRQGETIVRSDTIELNALNNGRLVIGVLSEESNVLPELSAIKGGDRPGNTLLRLTAPTLPDRAELLQSFDVLFVHALDTATLTDAQRTALSLWALNGGHLIIGGDRRVIAGLADVVPATAAAGGTSTLKALGTGTGWPVRNNAPQTPLLQLTPKPNAEVVRVGDAGQPLLIRQSTGSGSISVTAFALDALRDTGDAADFWSRVLPLAFQQPPVWSQLRDQGIWTLQQALKLPALRLPSILGFLGFLLLYILIVGPMNYLLLRRWDRREWGYITIPLLVVVFSGGAYVWGTSGRGQAPILSELSIVRVGQNRMQAQAMSYLALFSPARRAYDLRLPADALVGDLQQPWQRQSRTTDVQYAEDSVRFPNLLVDVGGVRAFAVERVVAAPDVTATQRMMDGKPQVTIRNRSDREISGLMIVRGDGRSQLVDTLAPGAERTLSFAPDRWLQDGMNDLDGSALIDRRTVLNQLGNVVLPGVFNNGAPPQAFAEAELPPTPTASGGSAVEEETVSPLAPTALATVLPSVPTAEPPAYPPPAFGAGAAQPRRAGQDALPDPQNNLMLLGWQDQPLVPVTLDGGNAASSGETLFVWQIGKE